MLFQQVAERQAGLAAADSAAERTKLRDWFVNLTRGQSRDPAPAVDAVQAAAHAVAVAHG